MNKTTEIAAGERLHELREKLLNVKLVTTEQFFILGEIMKEIRDEDLWKIDSHSFESFYSDPELAYPTSTVYHAIKVVETFPDWKKVLDIPISKLVMIAPHIKEENEKELTGYARGLGRGDLRHELLEHGLQPERGGTLPVPKTYRCENCKGIKGLTFDELCHCGWTKDQVDGVGKLIDKINFGEELGEEEVEEDV